MLIEEISNLESKNPKKANILISGYRKQRELFFENRIKNLKQLYDLQPSDEKSLYGYLISCEEKKDDSFPIIHCMSQLTIEDELAKDEPEYYAYLGWLKTYWSKAWVEYTNDNQAILAAKFILASLKKMKRNKSANLFGAERELANELSNCLPKANKIVNLEFRNTEIIKMKGISVLKLDSLALKYFQKNNIGATSSKTIKIFKGILEDKNYNIEERIQSWEDPLFLAKRIALCRWHDMVEKYVRTNLVNPPALSLTVATNVVKLTTKGNKLDKLEKHVMSSNNKIITNFVPSPSIPLLLAKDLASKDMEYLNSILAKRIIRWFSMTAHKQHFLNTKYPNVITIDGGFHTLGGIIGAGTGTSAIKKMKKIVSLYASCGYHLELENHTINGNILMYEFIESKRGSAQQLTITLARAFCPGYVRTSSEDSRYSFEKLLVPVLNEEPTFIGKKNTFCSQMNFMDWLLIELRLRAVELYERNGVHLTSDNWSKIAAKAKMSPNLINKVIECWKSEEFIEETDDSIFNLGNRYQNEKKMLTIAGEKTVKGSLAAKKRKKTKEKSYIKQT